MIVVVTEREKTVYVFVSLSCLPLSLISGIDRTPLVIVNIKTHNVFFQLDEFYWALSIFILIYNTFLTYSGLYLINRILNSERVIYHYLRRAK